MGWWVQCAPRYNALELRMATFLPQTAGSLWEGPTACRWWAPLLCAAVLCRCQALPRIPTLNSWCRKRSDSPAETGQQTPICSSYVSHYSLNEVSLPWCRVWR